MRTLVGDRSGKEGRVFSELAETILRQRSGDGVIPQVIEKAHENMESADTDCYGNLDRYLTKTSARHGFQNHIWAVDLNWFYTTWTEDLDSLRDKVWQTRGSQNCGD